MSGGSAAGHVFSKQPASDGSSQDRSSLELIPVDDMPGNLLEMKLLFYNRSGTSELRPPAGLLNLNQY